ncbi:PaaI family thioesterase [Quadrisphaera sp. DSM 44207]|uniref:PaaI family thioesterase n=1 Tax=Quadrisphaera sp. DSM 44207 TaxID=1881057 RepID=UPI0008923ACE|nr:PaaI family thioesterase [Quadrisphaera sp. DSM 44207]SDQ04921.1 uncharacterized domain 1-containing protein [Quadrisphaera sp. DSM 44207]
MDAPAGYSVLPDQGSFLEHVGPLHVADDDGRPVFGLRIEERHLNARGTVQGGLLSTLADIALSRGIAHEAEDDRGRATVSLTVDFLAAAQVGDWLEARTRVDRVGGSLAFADCSVRTGEREVVRARAVFVAVD